MSQVPAAEHCWSKGKTVQRSTVTCAEPGLWQISATTQQWRVGPGAACFLSMAVPALLVHICCFSMGH